MFALFKDRRKDLDAAEMLYQQIITQSREPVFYEIYRVPDTVEGRFELVCLHTFLVMDRLFEEEKAGTRLAQALFDIMFRDIDRSLREMGVGDLSLPKHVKRMMKGFNGRASAYQQAMTADHSDQLIQTLCRNLYGTMANPPEDMARIMALYMHESAAWLSAQDWEALMRGDISFKDMDQEWESDDDRDNITGMVA